MQPKQLIFNKRWLPLFQRIRLAIGKEKHLKKECRIVGFFTAIYEELL
jgi:hypothetical protein